MSPVEEFAFLEPWHRLLPDRGVVAVAGSGGCTTVLLALLEVWRERRTRVLVSQTEAHPVPFPLIDCEVEAEAGAVRERLDRDGVAFVAGAQGTGRRPGLHPDRLEELRAGSGADVLLVQAQASAGQLVRTRPVEPVWPRGLGLAVLVAQVGAAGRLWNAATGEPDPALPPRRVEVSDLVASLRPVLDSLPPGARPLPFLTGLGAWRDLDGMFAIVQEFWEDPRVWVVVLGELIGDERRDAADLRGLPGHVEDPFATGRVYAVYPAALDDGGPPA